MHRDLEPFEKFTDKALPILQKVGIGFFMLATAWVIVNSGEDQTEPSAPDRSELESGLAYNPNQAPGSDANIRVIVESSQPKVHSKPAQPGSVSTQR